jgi:hypothetical protein
MLGKTDGVTQGDELDGQSHGEFRRVNLKLIEPSEKAAARLVVEGSSPASGIARKWG